MDSLYLVEYLYLYNCDLTVVGNYSFRDMHSLKMLDLSQNNKLYMLGPHAFQGLYSTTNLYLDDTMIEELHEEQFMDMPLLTQLSAAAMNIKYIPDQLFHNNRLLEQIFFTSNNIQFINETFQHMKYLSVLSLDGNAIEGFNNFSFINCCSLTYLDISSQHNGKSPLIRYIPKTIINHTNKTLVTLFIGSNNITVFDGTELNFFKHSSLETIFAEKNPYNCSCMPFTGKLFYNFVDWFNHTKKIPNRTRSLYSCTYSNRNQQGKLVQYFNFKVVYWFNLS